jgi:flavodoxin
MKILVAYYSKTGNTKRAAADIAAGLQADLEEIIDKKKRTGILNWFLSGRDGMKKLGTEIAEPAKDAAAYDMVIVGSPVWGWNIVPAVRTYLENNKGKIKNYAFFVTSGNTDSQKLAGYLKEIMNQESLAHTGFNTQELKDRNTYDRKISDFLAALRKSENSG